MVENIVKFIKNNPKSISLAFGSGFIVKEIYDNNIAAIAIALSVLITSTLIIKEKESE
ncbi:MAG: hypothetical protein QNJ33_17085 [Crocosphaera sp.]|nr:hypothetical protein [Crocosphaera sp.]